MRQPKRRALTRRSVAVKRRYSGGVFNSRSATAYHSGLRRSSTPCRAVIARAVTRGRNGRGRSVVAAGIRIGELGAGSWELGGCIPKGAILVGFVHPRRSTKFRGCICEVATKGIWDLGAGVL